MCAFLCLFGLGLVMLQSLSFVLWSLNRVQLVCDCKGVHTCCTSLVSSQVLDVPCQVAVQHMCLTQAVSFAVWDTVWH